MSGPRQLLPCDYCPNAGPMAESIAHLDARLERIEAALFGDDDGKKGIVRHVESLVDMTKVGRSTLRVFMWFGAAILALVTAAYQIKQAIFGLIH
jgi:hypothetical protein